MRTWLSRVRELVRDEAGVTAIEYGLLAALIAVAIIGAVSATGTSLGDVYTRWTEAVIGAIGSVL
ncbi:MAG: Flp family type IVb pilin [Burkholderiaceae bacterium]|nr:Flp family type IVb pilin [Burkholderiaceae bacterium]